MKSKLIKESFITIVGVEEDRSGTVLQQWLDNGYRECVWQYFEEPWQDENKWREMGGVCPTCYALNGQHFKLEDLLAEMEYDAPKYTKSHVGCKCLLKRVPKEEEQLHFPETEQGEEGTEEEGEW